MAIKKVGVIGAGQMGSGIAHVVALAGYDVAITDIAKEAVDKAMSNIDHNMDRQVGRGLITADEKAAALKRIHYVPDYDGFRDCDLVIEAATENEAVKRKIFTELCPKLKPEAIVASNTSSISITRLASITNAPSASSVCIS